MEAGNNSSNGKQIQKLSSLCVQTLIQAKALISDLGWLEVGALRAILSHCNHEELATIEDGCLHGSQREIIWYTWDLWARIYEVKYGRARTTEQADLLPLKGVQPSDYTTPVGIKTPVADWRSMLSRDLKAERDRADAISARLGKLYDKADREKASRSAKVCDIRPKMKRARHAGPSSSTYPVVGHSAGSSHATISHGPVKPVDPPRLKMLQEIGLVRKDIFGTFKEQHPQPKTRRTVVVVHAPIQSGKRYLGPHAAPPSHAGGHPKKPQVTSTTSWALPSGAGAGAKQPALSGASLKQPQAGAGAVVKKQIGSVPGAPAKPRHSVVIGSLGELKPGVSAPAKQPPKPLQHSVVIGILGGSKPLASAPLKQQPKALQHSVVGVGASSASATQQPSNAWALAKQQQPPLNSVGVTQPQQKQVKAGAGAGLQSKSERLPASSAPTRTPQLSSGDVLVLQPPHLREASARTQHTSCSPVSMKLEGVTLNGPGTQPVQQLTNTCANLTPANNRIVPASQLPAQSQGASRHATPPASQLPVHLQPPIRCGTPSMPQLPDHLQAALGGATPPAFVPADHPSGAVKRTRPFGGVSVGRAGQKPAQEASLARQLHQDQSIEQLQGLGQLLEQLEGRLPGSPAPREACPVAAPQTSVDSGHRVGQLLGQLQQDLGHLQQKQQHQRQLQQGQGQHHNQLQEGQFQQQQQQEQGQHHSQLQLGQQSGPGPLTQLLGQLQGQIQGSHSPAASLYPPWLAPNMQVGAALSQTSAGVPQAAPTEAMLGQLLGKLQGHLPQDSGCSAASAILHYSGGSTNEAPRHQAGPVPVTDHTGSSGTAMSRQPNRGHGNFPTSSHTVSCTTAPSLTGSKRMAGGMAGTDGPVAGAGEQQSAGKKRRPSSAL